ncbi:MAG TPA: ABC transporter permease [Candidatus Binatia bacterium]|nr:ABC transporter permease [Candidatus Binatia bacterium]
MSAETLGWLGIDRAALPGALWTLVRTDFKTRYRPTIGGFVWALLKPLAMFVVLLAVFSLVFRSEPQYRLNLIIGLFLWDFFVEATKVGLVSIQAKGFVLSKARFPAWILVVTSAANAVLTLLVFCVIIVAFLAASGRPPSPLAVGLFALYLLHFLVITLGFSLAASVLFLRYRDLNQVWEVVTQAGFFVAPIIYPLSVLPERVHAFVYLWPPTPIIQFSRRVLVDGVVPTARAHALLTLGTLAILGAGALIHRRAAPRAAEYL